MIRFVVLVLLADFAAAQIQPVESYVNMELQLRCNGKRKEGAEVQLWDSDPVFDDFIKSDITNFRGIVRFDEKSDDGWFGGPVDPYLLIRPFGGDRDVCGTECVRINLYNISSTNIHNPVYEEMVDLPEDMINGNVHECREIDYDWFQQKTQLTADDREDKTQQTDEEKH